MKALLAALEEGRLIELTGTNKSEALHILATLVEAIPGLRAGTQVVESILAREQAANTALGRGWACPHAHAPGEGEVLCAVGWNPAGIEYGAPDGKPVRIVVMYFVPDSQKNTYLREISGLARALQKKESFPELEQAKDLNEIRLRLLDMIASMLEADSTGARARMVQIEARQAAAGVSLVGSWQSRLVSVSVLVVPGRAAAVLTQDLKLVSLLEQNAELPAQLAKQDDFEIAGHRIIKRTAALYQPDRMLYDCLVLKPEQTANVKT
jgi:mannitol/fructose-specific phosphotransferase system IIA component (Ntr-type)